MDGIQAKVDKATRVTRRELQVLRLLAQGFLAKEVASRLGVSKRTVDFHTGKLFGKFGVNNRTRMLNEARRLGLIPFEPR